MMNRLHQCIAWIPFKLHWFFVFVSGALVPFLTRNHSDPKQRGEWYPFSNLPMYSTFEPTAFYVYVTDLEDRPVALVPTFGNLGSEVKKAYEKLLKEEVKRLKEEAAASGGKYRKRQAEMSGEECRPAGDAVLKQLRDNSKTQEEVRKYPGFRMYQVDIVLEEGKIVKREKLVGEVRP
jgi:hypothetical protein